jgi:hypothetical protein
MVTAGLSGINRRMNQKIYLAMNSEKNIDTLKMKYTNVVEVPYKLLSF